MPVNTRLQFRRGTASGWTSANPTLYAGEVGYETDTGRIKIGDGTTAWTSLKYATVTPTSSNFLAGSGLSVSVAADGSTVTYSLNDPTIQVSDISDLSASATELNYLDGSLPGTGVAGKAVVLDSNLNITNLGNVSTTGTLTVGGNLIVNGITTTVNSTTTTLDDPIITLGGDTAPGIDDNKDRGVEFRYYNGSAKTGFFGYDDSTGKFTFIPDATNTSEVFSGTKGELDANVDWSNILNKPDPVVSVNLTGDVTGSGNATLTDLANGNISISTTVASNSVALGTDTTGQYAKTLIVVGSGGGGAQGLSLTSANADDGTDYTLTINSSTNNLPGTLVFRSFDGGFSAGPIVATSFSGNGSSITGINASNIASGTLASGLLPDLSISNIYGSDTNNFISDLTVDSKGRVSSITKSFLIMASTSTIGAASFNSGDFDVSSGHVTIKTSGIGNSQLENDRVTIGQSPLVLGSTYSAISGISAANPVVLTYFSIDGGTP